MRPQIKDIVEQIAAKFHPEKIILFGSSASGKWNEDSDVDLLVVMNHRGSSRKQAVKILTAIEYHTPLDLIVQSHKQLLQRIEAGDFFLKEILEKGTVVYEQNLSGMG